MEFQLEGWETEIRSGKAGCDCVVMCCKGKTNLELVDNKVCYLGDMLSVDGDADAAV